VSVIRRLDHVAIAVADTETAIAQLGDRLGLAVIHREELARPAVRLTYLDLGNCLLQLVEPLDEAEPVAEWLRSHGDGLHHLCFGVDDVAGVAAALGDGSPVPLGSGRGRDSAFVAGTAAGVRLECTEFRREEDVERRAGWLPPS
jgi:methylmalonyl-CoA/ethylmalonyl-CoA epimerase